MKAKRDLTHITNLLLEWYDQHKRDLPWRKNTDPYSVWVSEVILQQTRVNQGLDYYLRFIKRFPDVASLAGASEEELLKLWQGLGYYSRALNLHAAAKEIMSRFNGIFPSSYADILSLKGVGKYTAAAIASISFHEPYAVADGNVFRVVARLFAVESPVDTTEGKRIISQIAQSLLDPDKPGIFNQAIMDFGSLICTPVQPKCTECPLQRNCLAYNRGKATAYPVISRKKLVRKRYFNYFHIIQGDKTFIQKRCTTDIWKNLYEFPLIETEKPMDFSHLSHTQDFKQLFTESTILQADHRLTVKHQLTHQAIYTEFYRVEISVEAAFNPPRHLICINREDLSAYPVSRLTDKYIEII